MQILNEPSHQEMHNAAMAWLIAQRRPQTPFSAALAGHTVTAAMCEEARRIARLPPEEREFARVKVRSSHDDHMAALEGSEIAAEQNARALGIQHVFGRRENR